MNSMPCIFPGTPWSAISKEHSSPHREVDQSIIGIPESLAVGSQLNWAPSPVGLFRLW
jgi:hypothetical protein